MKTTVRTVDGVVAVHLSHTPGGSDAEVVTATREHPFYVDGKGFTPAGALGIGNAIVTRAGPTLFVTKVEWQRQAQGYAVYNFVVEDDHTYFVGNTNGGTWVHNGVGDCVPSYGMHTFEMKDLTMGGMRGINTPGLTGRTQGYVVYVVRDVETGQLLKVGHTSIWRTRLLAYRTRAIKEGRQIAVDAFEVDQATARGLRPTLESQMQLNLKQQGHELPWDKSKVLKGVP